MHNNTRARPSQSMTTRKDKDRRDRSNKHNFVQNSAVHFIVVSTTFGSVNMMTISSLLSMLMISSLIGGGSEAFTFPSSQSLKVEQHHNVKVQTRASPSTATVINRSSVVLFAGSDESYKSKPTPTPALYHHHVAIRTRNIENAIKFYSLFGYEVEHKFRAGPARAAWLCNAMVPGQFNGSSDDEDKKEKKGQSSNVASRLEVIEVPGYLLNEKENTIQRALDLLSQEAALGLNHYALDVTPYINYLKDLRNSDDYYGLDQFLLQIESESKAKFGKTLRVAMSPRQQVIGTQVFELCFVYDADGAVVELVRYIKDLDQQISSGWEAWDGVGFVGSSGNSDASTSSSTSANTSDDDSTSSTSTQLKEEISKDVSSNTVVIYSKTRCPFCAKTKHLFETEFPTITPKIYELDTIENGSDIQGALKEMTRQRTVPSVWVRGSFIGGNDDTQRLFTSGELKEMLAL